MHHNREGRRSPAVLLGSSRTAWQKQSHPILSRVAFECAGVSVKGMLLHTHLNATTPKARGRRAAREKPASWRRLITPRVMLLPDLLSGLPT